MRPILGVDVDSTIWDLFVPAARAVLDVTGEEIDPEEAFTWTYLLDTYGEEAAVEIYTRVLDPRRVHEREPYPGSPEVLRALQEEMGICIHFITHNWDPEGMSPYLEPWLKGNFGIGIGLTVTMEDKLDVLERIGAFGMVDDRPATIARVADAGLWVATKIQPWNQRLVAARADVHGFASWHEFPDLLLYAWKAYSF